MNEKQFRVMSNEVKQLYCVESVDGEMFSIQEVVNLLNEQQAIIHRDETSIKTMMSNMEKLEEEKGYWKSKAMTLLLQVRRLTPRMTDKEVIEFSKELNDE